MPQINLSETNGPELRRLFYASRKRGDTALQEAVLHELNSRGARSQDPRTSADPVFDSGRFEARSPGAAAAVDGADDLEPSMRVASGPEGRGPLHDRPLPFGHYRAEPRVSGAPAPYEGEFKTTWSGPAAAPRALPRRSPSRAKPALAGGLALAIVCIGAWMAREGGARHEATTYVTRTAVVVPTLGTPRAPSTKRTDGVGTELAVAEKARVGQASASALRGQPPAAALPAPARPGQVVIQFPQAESSAVPVRSDPSELPPLPLALPAVRAFAAARVETPVRVFVHIAAEAQFAAVDRVRANLSGVRFGGQPIAMPPVRFVQSSPGRTEVRCLKHADCPAAAQIARHLAQGLQTPVAVVDMSRTYEADRNVRAGSLELWLRPEIGQSRQSTSG